VDVIAKKDPKVVHLLSNTVVDNTENTSGKKWKMTLDWKDVTKITNRHALS
jgi:hypothetical protein